MKVFNKSLSISKKLVIVNVVMYLVFGVASVVDYITGWRNLQLSNIVTILYPVIVTIGGSLISLYFLFLDIYRNRYPLEGMQKRHFTQAKSCFYAIVYNMIIGIVALWTGGGYFSSILFCVTSVITIIAIIRIISRSNESLMLTSYIRDFCKSVNSDIENNKSVVSAKTINSIKTIL